MAAFGAKYPVFHKYGETNGVVIGMLCSANMTVTIATGELYADNVLAEHVNEFVGASIAMESDNVNDEIATILYGCEVVDGVLTFTSTDTPPWGALGYYQCLMKDGVKFFRAIYYPKAKATLGNDNVTTKGNNITLSSIPTTFTVTEDENGVWREIKTFDKEKGAINWLNTKCAIGTTGA